MLFPEVLDSYNEIAHRLLAVDSETRFPHIPEVYITRFRAIHGSTAFQCRSVGCSKRSVGFPSVVDRDKHECSHSLRLFCKELSCPFASTEAFRTVAQLKKHIRIYHSAEPSIPEFFSRSAEPRPAETGLADKERVFSTLDLVSHETRSALPLKETHKLPDWAKDVLVEPYLTDKMVILSNLNSENQNGLLLLSSQEINTMLKRLLEQNPLFAKRRSDHNASGCKGC